MARSRADWVSPTPRPPPRDRWSAEKRLFPKIPPPAPPPASQNVTFLASPMSLPDLRNETVAMARTAHPDRKLIVAWSSLPMLSRTGLMMMPPPIPLIAPIVEATKQTAK